MLKRVTLSRLGRSLLLINLAAPSAGVLAQDESLRPGINEVFAERELDRWCATCTIDREGEVQSESRVRTSPNHLRTYLRGLGPAPRFPGSGAS